MNRELALIYSEQIAEDYIQDYLFLQQEREEQEYLERYSRPERNGKLIFSYRKRLRLFNKKRTFTGREPKNTLPF